MADRPQPRDPAQYGSTTDGPRYSRGDPDTRNGGGEDMEENLDQSASHDTIKCPRCEEEYGNLPKHLPVCDG